MITLSLPKTFAGVPYKPQQQVRWNIVGEPPQKDTPYIMLTLTKKQYETLSDSQIEGMFEEEYEKKCDELEASLDFSNFEDENTYSTFVIKGNRPQRRYLLIIK